MNKTYLIAGLGVGILALASVSVVFASTSNYGAWRAMMGNNGGRVATVVTEKNFDQFTQMHRQMADGNYTDAQKIRTELGLGQGQGKGAGKGCAMNKGGGQGGGCPMRNGGTKNENFVDANNNKICDHAEQLVK